MSPGGGSGTPGRARAFWGGPCSTRLTGPVPLRPSHLGPLGLQSHRAPRRRDAAEALGHQGRKLCRRWSRSPCSRTEGFFRVLLRESRAHAERGKTRQRRPRRSCPAVAALLGAGGSVGGFLSRMGRRVLIPGGMGRFRRRCRAYRQGGLIAADHRRAAREEKRGPGRDGPPPRRGSSGPVRRGSRAGSRKWRGRTPFRVQNVQRLGTLASLPGRRRLAFNPAPPRGPRSRGCSFFLLDARNSQGPGKKPRQFGHRRRGGGRGAGRAPPPQGGDRRVSAVRAFDGVGSRFASRFSTRVRDSLHRIRAGSTRIPTTPTAEPLDSSATRGRLTSSSWSRGARKRSAGADVCATVRSSGAWRI